MADRRDPDYDDDDDDEADEEEIGGTEARSTKIRQRKRKRGAVDRSSIEWQCVTIVDEDDDVNPRVQCKFCPWLSGAGATRIRQHILRNGTAAKCKGSSTEYNAMKSQLLEPEGGRHTAA